MSQRMYQVFGCLTVPLVFNVRAESEQAALEYANNIFNSSNILQIEMELDSKDNKTHLVIADTFTFDDWTSGE